MRERVVERVAKVLKAVANPTRLKILALCSIKEMSSREIRQILEISKPLLIAHLRKLMNVGLLDYRVEFDKEKKILRKYYRTKRDFVIYVDQETLRLIADEIIK